MHAESRIRRQDVFILRKGLDPTKDQSYVLYAMTQDQLAHTLFPLGTYTKKEIRQIAQEQGFINADKPDSPGYLLRSGR